MGCGCCRKVCIPTWMKESLLVTGKEMLRPTAMLVLTVRNPGLHPSRSLMFAKVADAFHSVLITCLPSSRTMHITYFHYFNQLKYTKYKSEAFSKFMVLENDHCCLVPQHFHHPEGNPAPLSHLSLLCPAAGSHQSMASSVFIPFCCMMYWMQQIL